MIGVMYKKDPHVCVKCNESYEKHLRCMLCTSLVHNTDYCDFCTKTFNPEKILKELDAH